MSLITELKRRNVFKVGIAYALTGWVLLQAGDFAFDLIGAPNWVIQTLFVLVILGLPLALVFAWAFELTPEGIKRESEVDRSQSVTSQTGKKLNTAILVLMALAIGYLLFDKFSGGSPATDSAPATAAAQPAASQESAPAPESSTVDTRPSIAVLPFDNRSPSDNDAYFVEGVHDDLLTNLARIGGLKVISRTSVAQYKDTTKTIPQIASELGVATVMEGAVQRSGDSVRINVQLIDAQTDEHLWAEIYDRDLTAQNLFAIQSEISSAIADALKATLSPEERKRISELPTDDLVAYDAYQRGRQLMATRRSDDLARSVTAFRQAVEQDPGFALAWVGLADATSLTAAYGSFTEEQAMPVMEEAFERATSIDPNLGEAWASIAQVYEYQGRYDDMEAAYRKAIELSPNYAQAYHWYANTLREVYPLRTQEILDLSRKAVELDPRAPIIVNNLANAYRARGLFSLAEQQYRKTLELNPDFTVSHHALSSLYGNGMGRFDLAIREMQLAVRDDPEAPNNAWEAWFWMELGEFERAATIRDRLALNSPDNPRLLALDLLTNARRGNLEGVREATAAVLLTPRPDPELLHWAAFNELALGDPKRALSLYERASPGWRQTDQWQRLARQWPDQACPVALAMQQSGEPTLGNDLLALSLEIHTQELPLATEHPDDWGTELCLLLAGDNEGALAEFERRVAHNHLAGLSIAHRLPVYDAIRFEPRYQAAWTTYRQRIAEQRVALGLDPETAL